MKATYKDLFQDLIHIMAQYNLSDVAERAGISVSTLYNWEKGKTTSPHLRTVYAVANACGFDIKLELRKQLKLVKVA